MSDESFLSRWSRRKAQSRTDKPAEEEKTPQAQAEAAAPEAVKVEDLPPVETLTGDSDFTAFLKPGVPEALRAAALRKLWQSDPVVAAGPELLDLHNLDYTLPKVPEVVNTIYRVGKGLMTEADEAAEAEAAAKEAGQAAEAAPPPACGGRQEGGSQPPDSALAERAAAAPSLPSPASGGGESEATVRSERDDQSISLPSEKKG